MTSFDTGEAFIVPLLYADIEVSGGVTRNSKFPLIPAGVASVPLLVGTQVIQINYLAALSLIIFQHFVVCRDYIPDNHTLSIFPPIQTLHATCKKPRSKF